MTNNDLSVVIETAQTIGQFVREKRKRLGLKPSDLAKMANTSVAFITDLEKGGESLSIGKVIHVLNLFHIDLQISSPD